MTKIDGFRQRKPVDFILYEILLFGIEIWKGICYRGNDKSEQIRMGLQKAPTLALLPISMLEFQGNCKHQFMPVGYTTSTPTMQPDIALAKSCIL